MKLYPSIDIRRGRTVRLVQGDFDREIDYSADPIAVAKRYEAAGAEWIHVVDLDASRQDGSNREMVVAIARTVDVPVQAGGGVVDDSLLREGVTRVVAGTAAVARPDWLKQLAAEWPAQVAVGLDHRDGEVRVRGWEEGTGLGILEAVRTFEVDGVGAFVVTAIARDGMLDGPDIATYTQLLAATDTPVVASGGVGTLDDIRGLAKLSASGRSLDGVIVGRALYEKQFSVEEAMAACKP